MNFVISAPVSSADPEANDSQVIHLINDILKREIIEETKNDTKLEIGDKIKDGTFSLSVATFKPGQLFPITFKPDVGQDDLENIKVVNVDGSWNGSDSAEFLLHEQHQKTAKPPSISTTEKSTLLKDIAAEPVILSQH